MTSLLKDKENKENKWKGNGMKCCGRETKSAYTASALKRTGARIQVIFDDLIFKTMEIFRFEAKNDYENDI